MRFVKYQKPKKKLFYKKQFMYKKIILFFALALTKISFGQQAYYNDVNLNLTGVTLKEELATKTNFSALFFNVGIKYNF